MQDISCCAKKCAYIGLSMSFYLVSTLPLGHLYGYESEKYSFVFLYAEIINQILNLNWGNKAN